MAAKDFTHNIANPPADGDPIPYIRAFIPTDLPALQEICEVTSAPQLIAGLPDQSLQATIYCTPYLVLPSGISFILSLPPTASNPAHPQGQPIGYIIGTLNTRRFITEYRQTYLPPLLLSARYGPPPSEPEALAKYLDEKRVAEEVRWIYDTLYRPEVMDTVLVEEGLTAHLHIDILPQYQGRGYGVDLLRAYEEKVKENVGKQGLRGYHLGMDEKNDRAAKWYSKMGLRDLTEKVGRGRWMGKYLDGSWEAEEDGKKKE